jgi:hypothetical protein
VMTRLVCEPAVCRAQREIETKVASRPGAVTAYKKSHPQVALHSIAQSASAVDDPVLGGLNETGSVCC